MAPNRREAQNSDKRDAIDPITTNQKLTLEDKYCVNKEHHDWKEDCITIPQKPKMENSESRNRKGEQIINRYPKRQHHWTKHAEVKEGKLTCDKHHCSPLGPELKYKT